MSRNLTPAELAERINGKTSTLAAWRSARIGPPYIKAGGKILYPEADFEAWLESRKVWPEPRARGKRPAEAVLT
jgi:hypothetical protein